MRHSERGVALVEFALHLPFLMLMLLGLVEIGRSGATNAGDSSGIHDEVMADGQKYHCKPDRERERRMCLLEQHYAH